MKHQGWYDGQTQRYTNTPPVAVLTGHTGILWDIRFARRSELIATAAEDGLVRIWSQDGTLHSILEGHQGQVRALTWSPNDQQLASASADGSVLVWNVRTKSATVLGTHRDAATTVSWSSDGKSIASGSYDKCVRIWNATDQRIGRTIDLGRSVSVVEWSPIGGHLVCGCSDGVLRFVDTDDDAAPREVRRRGRGGITTVAWSPDGKIVAAGGGGRTVALLDANNGRQLIEISAEADWNLSNPSVGSIGFSSSQDAERMIAIKCHQTVSFWRWDKPDLVATVRFPSASGKAYAESGGIAFDHTGNLVALRDDNSNDVFVWSIQSISKSIRASNQGAVRLSPQKRAEPERRLSSVFISYGGPDEEFAERLNAALNGAGVETFLFNEHAAPGQKLHRLMREGINRHDRVILICSRDSLNRPGVLNELEETLQREAREGGTSILIPVSIDEYVFSDWVPDRPDLAQAVRNRVVADFQGAVHCGKDFDARFARLVDVLLSVENADGGDNDP